MCAVAGASGGERVLIGAQRLGDLTDYHRFCLARDRDRRRGRHGAMGVTRARALDGDCAGGDDRRGGQARDGLRREGTGTRGK
jgi:hypothetical protein